MEGKTDNELIAEFMGGAFYDSADLDHPNKWWFREQPHEGYRKDATHLTSGLRYDRDWSWLMPVVEKIDKETNFEFTLPITTSIGDVYKTVVEFIKWYNRQKEK